MDLIPYELTKTYDSSRNIVRTLVVIFYGVGIIGMILPSTSETFMKLIPLALLLSFVLLLAFHSGLFNARAVAGILSLYLLSFLIEVAGVKSGIIFGSYQYGESLGLKIFGTPLIIGINWLLLSYGSASVAENLGLKGFWAIMASSLLMVFYDLILEQVAPITDMWHWKNNRIPAQNYGVWFILSVFFQLWIKRFGINVKNSLGWLIMLCQFVLILSLMVWYKVIL